MLRESHSVTDAHETAERVVACLLEWRDWLEDMAERFEQLAPHPDADAEDRSWHLERAVTRLVTAVVNSTHAESSWCGLCETTLTWFLTSTGVPWCVPPLVGPLACPRRSWQGCGGGLIMKRAIVMDTACA